jgi:peptidoglycan/LPS O-acetylase OafA/YrhL
MSPAGAASLGGKLVIVAVAYALTLVAAAASWRFFEGPIHSLKRRFAMTAG